jgi:16S rRNA (adenine1518-N6/adenine1519-N6)-dimethyltransferase
MKRKELLELLDQYGIRLLKGRSQHILINETILDEQIRLANIRKRDIVLEIGTGPGILTRALAAKAKKVITIEKDKRFQPYLEEALPDNTELIIDDVLNVDFPPFDKVVANIPYQISSKIIFKLLDYQFVVAIMLFQWEFANRMVATVDNPDYSRLSVKIFSRAHCEILKKVSRNAFFPVPKVDSAIIEMVPRAPPFEIHNELIFDKMVDAVFNQKRKTIKNALLNKSQWFNISKEELKGILDTLEYASFRGDGLSPAELAELSNILDFEIQKRSVKNQKE